MFATKFLEFRAHIYARLSLWHESEAVRFLSLWLALARLKSGHRCNPYLKKEMLWSDEEIVSIPLKSGHRCNLVQNLSNPYKKRGLNPLEIGSSV